MTAKRTIAFALSIALFAPAQAQERDPRAQRAVAAFGDFCARNFAKPELVRAALEKAGHPRAPAISVGTSETAYDASDSTGDFKVIVKEPGKCSVLAQKLRPAQIIALLEQTLKKTFTVYRQPSVGPTNTSVPMNTTDYVLVRGADIYFLFVFDIDIPGFPAIGIGMDRAPPGTKLPSTLPPPL